MRTLLSLGVATFWVATFSLLSTQADQCGSDDDTTGSGLLVGASTVTILPEVNGSTAYFDAYRDAPLAMEPGDDGRDPGLFIEQWDVGTLPIGNGARSSHWVHDEIRAGAVAFEDLDSPDDRILVLVGVDVYMMFRQDIQEVFDKVRRALGQGLYDRLWIVVASSHNHMGPDTSGLSGMNHEYYRYLTDQIASAIVDAVSHMEPAYLVVSSSRYQFGMADPSEPNIVDPTLNAMQARSTDDDHVIATVVQWQSHPEETLGFGRDIYATDEQAAYLNEIGECYSDDDGAHCYVEDQIISAGFPGYAVYELMRQTGAPAVYLNGPVGGLLGPLHAATWETEGPTGIPAGDGMVLPEGADIIGSNFHQTAVNGLELARRVLSDLETGEAVYDPTISMTKVEYYTRLTNIMFRAGLSVTVTGKPFILGHLPRELYVCPETGPWNDTTCVSDEYKSEPDPILGAPVRVGTFGKTEAHYIHIGPVSIITIPGEGFSELVEGIPADFVDDPRGVYYPGDRARFNHIPSDQYHTGGYARAAMTGTYKWAVGLANDELGYMRPLSDWRTGCVADEPLLGGEEGTCQAMYEAGLVDFVNYDGDEWAVAGERCKAITEHPELLDQPPYSLFPNGADLALMNCRYGQLFGADDHYEETMSAGWDYAENWIEAVKVLTEWEGSLEEVNPDFIGYNVLN